MLRLPTARYSWRVNRARQVESPVQSRPSENPRPQIRSQTKRENLSQGSQALRHMSVFRCHLRRTGVRQGEGATASGGQQMNVGIDLQDTLPSAPEFFSKLLKTWR